MFASVSPPTIALSSLRKIRNAYARSPRWSSAYLFSLRRKAPRVRSSGGQVGSHGVRNARLISRKAAHSLKSPLCGARNVTPAPTMPGIVSFELTVLKNAMLGRAANKTFSDRGCAGKPVAWPECRDRGLCASDQSAAGGAVPLNSDSVDLADDLFERNRASICKHLPCQLAYARLGAFQRHQKACLHLGLGTANLGVVQSLGGIADLLDHNAHELGGVG